MHLGKPLGYCFGVQSTLFESTMAEDARNAVAAQVSGTRVNDAADHHPGGNVASVGDESHSLQSLPDEARSHSKRGKDLACGSTSGFANLTNVE